MPQSAPQPPPPTDDLPPPVGQFHYSRHAPRLPSLAQGMETQRHAVAIAGGGPVGSATWTRSAKPICPGRRSGPRSTAPAR